MFFLTLGTIIDQHENISTFSVVDSSKKGLLPNTGEIQMFCIGVIVSLIIVGAGIIIGRKYINYKKKRNINVMLLLLITSSFILSRNVYALDKANSELNLQLINQIIRIKNVSYPKFDEVDLAKKDFSMNSTNDLNITIENHNNKVTNFRLGYSWNIISKEKNIGSNAFLNIGQGNVTSEQPVTTTIFENEGILENTVVDLVSITSEDNQLLEYRVPKDDITLNVDGRADTGTYSIYQRIYLIHDKEND